MKIAKSALAYLSMFALTSLKYFFCWKHTQYNKQEERKEDLIKLLLKDHNENMLKRTLK